MSGFVELYEGFRLLHLFVCEEALQDVPEEKLRPLASGGVRLNQRELLFGEAREFTPTIVVAVRLRQPKKNDGSRPV